MPNVVLLGTFDTKGAELAFVRDLLVGQGLTVTRVDCGVRPNPQYEADISCAEVARAAGADVDALAAGGDRGLAVTTMARGAERIVAELHAGNRLDAALALGGTGGTSIAAQAFRPLPLGLPKVIVSTAASSDVSIYVGESDLVLFPSVVDIAGVNRISAPILTNAAAAIVGMLKVPRGTLPAERPMVGASMFGVTTPSVTEGRRLLESSGYEVLTFHMVGSGGRTLESLVHNGLLAGVLDITTTELADELVGGVFSAGPGRLTHAGSPPVPRVVSVGALDMVNFGPRETVPSEFQNRNLFVHNASVTLMRTTPAECRELGKRLAERASALDAPVAIILPLKGVSMIAVEGGPFYDPEADDELFTAIRKHIGSHVQLVEMDTDVNDPQFARTAVDLLEALIARSR